MELIYGIPNRGMWWVFILFFAFPLTMLGQSERGRQMVRKYVEEMGRITTPSKGKVYFMDMEVSAAPRDGRTRPFTQRVKSYLMHDRMIYDSDKVTILQDKDVMYVLLHETRKLMIDKSMINDSSASKMKQMLEFQMDLIDNCSVTACNEVKYHENEYVMVSLVPKQQTKESLNINKISLYFQKKIESVAIVVMYFAEDHNIRSQEIRYREISFDYRDLDPNLSVRNYIYENNGSVKEKYSSYEVFDKRK